jgi:Ca2+-binding RTX toxin-like protein
VRVQHAGDDLVLSINGTDDTLTVNNWFADESGSWQVEQIQFADGTLWSVTDIKQMVLQGTPEDDLLIGYSTDDTITGLAGQDTIFGNAGDDTIDPGPGDDYAEGGIGNDRYVFGRGYNQDTVVDYDENLGNIDTISLVADVLPSDVTLEIDGTNLRVVINDTNDSLLVANWFADDAFKVERIEFADGTVWDTQYIMDNARSENVILGTLNDDNLVGTDREDTLIGLQGNDTLAGGLGSDKYVLSKGSGMDRIVENDSSTGSLDVVQFLDVASTELDSMERWGNDLVLFYGDDHPDSAYTLLDRSVYFAATHGVHETPLQRISSPWLLPCSVAAAAKSYFEMPGKRTCHIGG